MAGRMWRGLERIQNARVHVIDLRQLVPEIRW